MWSRIDDPPFYSQTGFYFRRASELSDIYQTLNAHTGDLNNYFVNVRTFDACNLMRAT